MGLLPNLSDRGPEINCPIAKDKKYIESTNWVSEKETFKLDLICDKAGEIIVMPITGIATATAIISILGFFK